MKLFLGDFLEVSSKIGKVDMVLCDPPYGTTGARLDKMIPLEPMWRCIERVTRPESAIVLTCNQPYTSKLLMSNPKNYKHCWVWNKKKGGNFAVLKYQPYKIHEDILVFCRGKLGYYPIMSNQKPRTGRTYSVSKSVGSIMYGDERVYNKKYPQSIIKISNANQRGKFHPSQKPVELMEYLLRTYSKPGQRVLDFAMGSGTTGEACSNLGRDFVGVEKDPEMFSLCTKRLEGVDNDLFTRRGALIVMRKH